MKSSLVPWVTAAVAFASCAASPHALAAPAARPHVTAALLTERDALQPGRPLAVGVRLVMEPGWHTYWRNPGDSGLPTRIRWTLPAGVEAGETRWPYPAQFRSGPLVSYGYEHEVLLLVELSVAPRLAAAEARLTARVDWLECREDLCIPGRSDLSLVLPVRTRSNPTRDATTFAAARSRLPAADPRWRIAASADPLAVSFRPPSGAVVEQAYFYAITPRVLDYGRPQALERTKTGWWLRLARDPNGTLPQSLAGVLVATAAGREHALVVEVSMGRNSPKSGGPTRR